MATDQNIHSLKNTNPSLCLFCIVRWALQDIGGACLWGRKVAASLRKAAERRGEAATWCAVHFERSAAGYWWGADSVCGQPPLAKLPLNRQRKQYCSTVVDIFCVPFVALLGINNLTHHTRQVLNNIGKTIRDNIMTYHELKSLTRVVVSTFRAFCEG